MISVRLAPVGSGTTTTRYCCLEKLVSHRKQQLVVQIGEKDEWHMRLRFPGLYES